jgi:hypothetical protein
MIRTAMRVLDGNKRALPVLRMHQEGQGERSDRLAWPGANAEGEMSVAESALWLLLEVDGNELRRLPLHFDRAGVTTIRG